jgi:hypothetical protein
MPDWFRGNEKCQNDVKKSSKMFASDYGTARSTVRKKMKENDDKNGQQSIFFFSQISMSSTLPVHILSLHVTRLVTLRYLAFTL